MKNKLKTVIVLIDQIIIIAFIITLVVIIKNIISDKATSAESASEQAVIQVQQEPVSTSETAESTTSEQTVDEPSSEIEDTVSTSETAESTIDEQSEPVDESNDVQVDNSEYVIDFGDENDYWTPDTIPEDATIADLPTEEQSRWAWELIEKNHTVLH